MQGFHLTSAESAGLIWMFKWQLPGLWSSPFSSSRAPSTSKALAKRFRMRPSPWRPSWDGQVSCPGPIERTGNRPLKLSVAVCWCRPFYKRWCWIEGSVMRRSCGSLWKTFLALSGSCKVSFVFFPIENWDGTMTSIFFGSPFWGRAPRSPVHWYDPGI